MRNTQPTRKPNARDCGVGGHPLGRTLISQQQDWGTSGSQWSLSPLPCVWTPSMARWLTGRGMGEGGRCQPPGPSPILFASKFLSNTFWGFPQPPTPDLSWQVWVPLSSPGRGWNRIKSWGFQSPVFEEGSGSFRAWYLSRAWNAGDILFTPDLLQPHPQSDAPATFPLPF